MRLYEYIAKKVSFRDIERFLNEYAKKGFFHVSMVPCGVSVSDEGEDIRVEMSSEHYNVIMAKPVASERKFADDLGRPLS